MTDHAAILERLAAYRAHDAPTHGGRVLAYVYDHGRPDLDALAAQAAASVLAVNGLDPTTFPSVALMEGDLVGFGRTMLHGPDATGSVTSGGTESILLAVKAARDRWRARRSTGTPRLVLPASGHAAFHKATAYLGLEVVVVPVDPATGRVDAGRVAEAIDAAPDRTALVVASAPSYPHGVVDPIADIAAAAAARGVPCHVDACVGGFVLPWWADAGGAAVPAWDLGVPGVTSISADLHKYGYAPKGTSLLLFADSELDLARMFAHTDWPGYPVVNATALGSRSVAGLAAAWAVVIALGRDGYTELTRAVVRATDAVRAAVGSIEGLRVLGDPDGPLLAAVADPDVAPDRRVDPHQWCAAVAERGFVLQGQPGLVQGDGTVLPRSAHLTITPVTDAHLSDLVAALVDGADAARGVPPARPEGGVPDPEALAHAARRGGDLDLAGVLALVEALPRDQSAELLARFLAAFTAPVT